MRKIIIFLFSVAFTLIASAQSSRDTENLFGQFIQYGQNGQDSLAIVTGEQLLSNIKSTIGDDNVMYYGVEYEMSRLYYRIGDTTTAERLHKHSLEACLEQLDKSNDSYLGMMIELANLYQRQGQYEQAIERFEQVMSDDRFSTLEDEQQYSVMGNLAEVYHSVGRYDKAIYLFDTLIEKQKQSLGEASREYINSLCHYAMLLKDASQDNEQTAKARNIVRQATALAHEHYGENDPLFAYCLRCSANVLQSETPFDEVVAMFQQAIDIMKRQPEAIPIDYMFWLQELGEAQQQNGDIDNAIKNLDAYNELVVANLGHESNAYAIGLRGLATCYAKQDKLIQAAQAYKQAMEITERNTGVNSLYYANLNSDLARVHYAMGDLHTALQEFERSLTIINEIEGESALAADVLYGIARCYSSLSDYKKAEAYYNRILSICEKIYGSGSIYASAALSGLADIYVEFGDFAKAKELYNRVLLLEEKFVGKDSFNYAETLAQLAAVLRAEGDLDGALRIYDTIMPIIDKRSGRESITYAHYQNSVAQLLQQKGELQTSLETIDAAIAILDKSEYAVSQMEYFAVLMTKADILAEMSRHNEAMQLYEKCQSLAENALGTKQSSEYLGVLESLADLYTADNDRSLELANEILRLSETIYGKGNYQYAQALTQIGGVFANAERYSDAIKTYRQAIDITINEHGKDSYLLTNPLGGLAYCYNWIGNQDEALRISKQSAELIKTRFGEESIQYALSLIDVATYLPMDSINQSLEMCLLAETILARSSNNNDCYADLLAMIANCYGAKKDIASASIYFEKSLKLLEQIYGKVSVPYVFRELDFARAYANCGEYNKALSMCNKHKSLFEPDDDSMSHLQLLGQIAFCHYKLKDTDSTLVVLRQAVDLTHNKLLEQFATMTSTERSNYWQMFQSDFMEALPSIVYESNNTEYNGYVYDMSCLFSKGILLNIGTEMKKLIAESGDKQLVDKFEQLQYAQVALNKQYELPADKRFLSVDSLTRAIDDMERDLMSSCKVYGDYSRNLKVNWKDVQARLRDGEMAVEFLSFPLMADSSRTVYVALTLKKDYHQPKMIALFDQSQLEKILQIEQYYSKRMNFTNISKLVWKPLEEELQGVNKVYFAASGLLHQVPIESLPMWSGEGYLADNISLYRLSSTRQLALQNTPSGQPSGMKVFCDADFMMSPQMMASNITASDNENLYTYLSPSATSQTRGASWNRLPNTRVEAEKIDSIFGGPSVVKLFDGVRCTEEHFKEMSGSATKYIHIATHGFYYNETQAEAVRNDSHRSGDLAARIRFMQSDRKNNVYSEDKAMTRSGLLFCGGGTAMSGAELPIDVEDGVLTAQEASKMDLRGLQLIVMSACETGLGDVGGEGVFGIQRGFKMAGAHSIVMSLWKVDDAATQILMTAFYKAIKDGSTPYEALEAAKEVVRSTNYEYSKPLYWAPFILVDGI